MNDNLKISALRLSLYDFSSPGKVMKGFEPKAATKTAWIPQTIADQVWAMYEFETEGDRVQWESTLPEQLAKCLDRSLIIHASRYGWKIRDTNGWSN